MIFPKIVSTKDKNPVFPIISHNTTFLVFKELDRTSLLRAEMVCSSWQSFIRTTRLWFDQCNDYAPDMGFRFKSETDFKTVFISLITSAIVRENVRLLGSETIQGAFDRTQRMYGVRQRSNGQTFVMGPILKSSKLGVLEMALSIDRHYLVRAQKVIVDDNRAGLDGQERRLVTDYYFLLSKNELGEIACTRLAATANTLNGKVELYLKAAIITNYPRSKHYAGDWTKQVENLLKERRSTI